MLKIQYYQINSASRNEYAGELLLLVLNLCISSAHTVSLYLLYLRRAIGHLPQKSILKTHAM